MNVIDKFKYLTGIGARTTPISIKPLIAELAMWFKHNNYVLRSGGAHGSDSFWEESYQNPPIESEIYLPFKNFNNNKSSLYGVCQKALNIAESVHPNWRACSEHAKLLHGRNVYQILGKDLNTPSDLVICWTPDAKIVGGTATAIKLARQYGISVFNLACEIDRINLDFFRNLSK